MSAIVEIPIEPKYQFVSIHQNFIDKRDGNKKQRSKVYKVHKDEKLVDPYEDMKNLQETLDSGHSARKTSPFKK